MLQRMAIYCYVCLALSGMSHTDSRPPEAGQAGQLTHVAVGLAIRAAHGVIVPGAHHLAVLLAFSIVGHGHTTLLHASSGSQLAHVAIGDTVGAAHGVVVHGAHPLALISLLGSRGALSSTNHADLLLLQTVLAGQLTHVAIGLAIGAAHGVVVPGAHHLALAALSYNR